MRSILQNYIHKIIISPGKQRTEAYQLGVEGNIFSLGTVLTREMRNMCSTITERVDRGRSDVLDSGESQSLQ